MIRGLYICIHIGPYYEVTTFEFNGTPWINEFRWISWTGRAIWPRTIFSLQVEVIR